MAGLTLVAEIASLPLSFYGGFILEHRYGLSNESLGAWLKDQAKSLAIGLGLGVAAASTVYFFIRLSPSGWWLPAGVLFAAVIVVLTNLAPVLLLPLFYQVKPLDREALRVRLLALAERSGARVLGAYEWGLGEKTKKANAALAGLGGTRRILVSDTMLAEYSDEEIEIVLAHELAHHVHGDIWKGLLFESVLVIAAFFVAARALEASIGWLALRGTADVAGLPLLVLAGGAVSLIMVAGGQRLVPRLRAERRPVRPGNHQKPRGVHLRHEAARCAESRGRASVEDWRSGCSTAIRPSANASRQPRPSGARAAWPCQDGVRATAYGSLPYVPEMAFSRFED